MTVRYARMPILSIPDLTLHYNDHRGAPALRELIVTGESGLHAGDVLVTGEAAVWRNLLEVEGTYVGAGHWFELPDVCFRLGYGWPTRVELKAGLRGISRTLRG